MHWKELFYFSNGERRALLLLLIICSISSLLLYKPAAQPETSPEPQPGFTASALPVSADSSVVESKPVISAKKAGRSKPVYTPKSSKLPAGTKVELNSADTLLLKQVPGIGSSYARRIVKYRKLLGGYTSVSQLRELYGMDEARYIQLEPWFEVDTTLLVKLSVNHAEYKELLRHPYLDAAQTRVIDRLRRQKNGLKGWYELRLLDEFGKADSVRLAPYLLFD